MHATIGAADALGEPLIGLLGSPDHYRRFGFVVSNTVGVSVPEPAWGPYFQVRTLTLHHSDVRGRFTYARPFGETQHPDRPLGSLDNGRGVDHSAWMPKPALKPAEREIETYRANRSQGSRAVMRASASDGPTSAVLLPQARRQYRGQDWECDLASITSVGLSERGHNPFDGSMRRRLKIECDGATDFFVVNKAKSVATAIRTAAGR